jgi:hypothetical protein
MCRCVLGLQLVGSRDPTIPHFAAAVPAFLDAAQCDGTIAVEFHDPTVRKRSCVTPEFA